MELVKPNEMQKERPGTPKLRDAKRNRTVSARTPDRLRNTASDLSVLGSSRTTSFRHRTTMGPGDFLAPQGLITKRRIGGLGRQSIMPPAQPPFQLPTKPEIDCNDHELGLLYDKYLQTIMTEIVTKKCIGEKERTMHNQLASIAKERDLAEDKLNKVKLRQMEIKDLSLLQNNVDSQNVDATSCIDDLEENKVKEKLSEMKLILEPMDQLRCNGVVIPEATNDLEEVLRIMNESSHTLALIKESIGDKGDTYESVRKGLDDFINKHSEIENIQKKCADILCGLQVLVLKEASHSLAQNDIDD